MTMPCVQRSIRSSTWGLAMSKGNEVLRLHTDADGFVWYGDDAQFAVNSFLEPAQFVEDDERAGVDVRDTKAVRVLGVRENANLIVALQHCRTANFVTQRVQLAPPTALPAVARTDPRKVLHYLWQPPAHLAGAFKWMQRQDFCTYAMIDQMAIEKNGAVGEAARRILAYHPVWPGLAFVNGFSKDDACRLVREVVDPRWYRHETRPGRWNKLFLYMGLTPENAAAFMTGSEPGRNFERAKVVLHSWYKHQEGTPGVRSAFLWHAYRSQKTRETGLLAAGKRLLQLVATLWSHAVSPPHPEFRFDPKRFFCDDDEAAAFAAHVARAKGV